MAKKWVMTYTNMYLLGFLAEELMKILGYTNTSAFRRYVKIDNFRIPIV